MVDNEGKKENKYAIWRTRDGHAQLLHYTRGWRVGDDNVSHYGLNYVAIDITKDEAIAWTKLLEASGIEVRHSVLRG